MEKVLLHLYKHNSIKARDSETVSSRYGNRYGEFPNLLVNSIKAKDSEIVSYCYRNRYGEFPNRLVNSKVKKYRFYLFMSQFD